MSSFICSPNHFASIEEAFKKQFKSPRFNTHPFKKFGLNKSPDQNEKRLSKTFAYLKELNALSYFTQYKLHQEKTISEETADYMTAIDNLKPQPIKLNTLELYNALSCLRYQIEEEEVSEEDTMLNIKGLIKFLETAISTTAKYFCDQQEQDRHEEIVWCID